MKKALYSALIIALSLGLFSAGFDNALAQNKIIRKTVKKVVRPQIAPTPTPKVTSDEIAPEPPAPPTLITQEAEMPKEKRGLFGWGLNTDLGGFYLYNRSGMQSLLGVIGTRINLLFADPLMLGSRIGLAEDALEYKVGLGLAFGNDVNNNPINSIPLYTGATLYLKEGAFFGLDPYISIGINYNLYGTGQQSGGMGTQLAAGALVDFGSELGKTGFTLGYNSIKIANALTAEGIFFSVTQPFVL